VKTHKGTGKKYCENRKELADKYFNITGATGLNVYAEGSLGIVTLLSDLQHMVARGFNAQEKEYWREVMNDIKCILIEDSKKEPELLEALKTMLVATDFNAPLPKGHPGHGAYLEIVAKPRAKQAIAKAEGEK